jgi:hypothetical protein
MKPYVSHRPARGHLIKVIAVAQITLTVGSHLVFHKSWLATSASLALALAILLFSRERIQDERVEQLKLKAISYGLFSGLFVAAFLHTGQRVMKRSTVPLPLSVFDTVIIMLVVALALFHFWRWRDGRAAQAE